MDQIRQSILARARIDGYTTWWARKVFCFQFFTYKESFGFAFWGGGASPPLSVVSLLFSVSYPQDRRLLLLVL